MKIRKATYWSIVIGLLAVLTGFIVNTYESIDINNENYKTEKVLSTVEAQTVENTTAESKNVADILENTLKSVVGISKLKDTTSSIFSNGNEAQYGIGTGVIVTENGYILSNEHVTGEKFSTCYITLENGKKYQGVVQWSDKDLDLSIVKIDTNKLSFVEFADSDNIRIGESVYAIGNPIGYEFRRTVTSGIISSKNRTIKLEENGKESYMSSLIQTDATINPGNSGGPLIYPNGQVIGINTVKISTADGIGFAIPINVVKPVIESFKATGKFEQANIGIYAYDKEVVPYLDNRLSFSEGIYVAQIIENGPASKTELKVGDIITRIDGIELETMNDLREYIYKKKPRRSSNTKYFKRKNFQNNSNNTKCKLKKSK